MYKNAHQTNRNCKLTKQKTMKISTQSFTLSQKVLAKFTINLSLQMGAARSVQPSVCLSIDCSQSQFFFNSWLCLPVVVVVVIIIITDSIVICIRVIIYNDEPILSQNDVVAVVALLLAMIVTNNTRLILPSEQTINVQMPNQRDSKRPRTTTATINK